MGLLSQPFVPKCSLFLILSLFLTRCVSSVKQPCLYSERSALLQLKESFILKKSASGHPKFGSWKGEGEDGGDCCSWDGVECDDSTGHVTGLDLGSSFLHGSIHSNNSLFQLHHLRKLDLSDNDFNGSKIPLAIGRLSRLSHLDLSFSEFSGQIPYEVLELSKLVILDLSGNDLELRKPSLKSLAERLINLKHLNLDGVKASSTIPQSLANLSSLTYLSLEYCELHGEFPVDVFQLPNLQYLSACDNTFLTGRLPEFAKNTSLEGLGVARTSFSGELPKSIGNLKSLRGLQLRDCNFSGPIPTSIANLTQLTFLALGQNEFSPTTLSWLGKLSKLTALELDSTNSKGDVLSSLKNLTMLNELLVSQNQFSSRIPSWLGNLTRLVYIDLGVNELWGPLPTSIFTLVNLEVLDLEINHISGSYNLESFLNLKNVRHLQLASNNFSLLTSTVTNVSVPKLTYLTLDSCNLLEFPNFLSSQHELQFLSLADNKIHGLIPKWLWGLSAETLEVLDLRGNFLTGFHQPIVVPPWTNIRELDLSSNKLQGSLPVPPASIAHYYASNNLLKGEISSMICNLPSITLLDISNIACGMLPPCLGNLSNHFQY
ncbi:receptor-like protein 7 [Hibiscus syriacus]|uniref:receptor-like protein 7 n=1 Tax=Hibiscus syriacus TaxID=106335 RepID=UPI0019247824|nr:receptor-like protein 7 [Hibiscus syriacus]